MKKTKKVEKATEPVEPTAETTQQESSTEPLNSQEFNEQFKEASTDTIPVHVAFSKADLLTFTNLMSICAQTFEQLALAAAKENQTGSFDILAARHRLCSAFATKLAAHYNIGEPESSNLH
jgi:hypothetical protein